MSGHGFRVGDRVMVISAPNKFYRSLLGQEGVVTHVLDVHVRIAETSTSAVGLYIKTDHLTNVSQKTREVNMNINKLRTRSISALASTIITALPAIVQGNRVGSYEPLPTITLAEIKRFQPCSTGRSNFIAGARIQLGVSEAKLIDTTPVTLATLLRTVGVSHIGWVLNNLPEYNNRIFRLAVLDALNAIITNGQALLSEIHNPPRLQATIDMLYHGSLSPNNVGEATRSYVNSTDGQDTGVTPGVRRLLRGVENLSALGTGGWNGRLSGQEVMEIIASALDAREAAHRGETVTPPAEQPAAVTVVAPTTPTTQYRVITNRYPRNGDRVRFTEDKSPANVGDIGVVVGNDDGPHSDIIYHIRLEKNGGNYGARSYFRRFEIIEAITEEAETEETPATGAVEAPVPVAEVATDTEVATGTLVLTEGQRVRVGETMYTLNGITLTPDPARVPQRGEVWTQDGLKYLVLHRDQIICLSNSQVTSLRPLYNQATGRLSATYLRTI